MSRSTWIVLAASLSWLSVVVVVPAGAGETSAPGVRVVTDHPNSEPGSPDRAPENYGIALELFRREPELWGGAFVDGDVLVIKFSGQSEESAAETLRASGIDGPVRLESSEITFGDLQRATDAVASIAIGDDIPMVSWGPNYADSSLAVDLNGEDGKASNALANVKVPVTLRLNVSPSTSTASRYYDAISYNGGNSVAFANSSSWGYCSTGFNLTGSGDGYAYAVSAGHCYQEVVKNPTARPSVQVFRTGGTRSTSGTVWTVSTNANGTVAGRSGDLAIFRYIPVAGYTANQMGNPTVYYGNGDSSLSQRRIIKGVEVLPQGYQSNAIYTSGASGHASGSNTGQITPDWISLVGQTLTYNTGFRITDMTVAEDASECVMPGDSGGAFYRINGQVTQWRLE